MFGLTQWVDFPRGCSIIQGGLEGLRERCSMFGTPLVPIILETSFLGPDILGKGFQKSFFRSWRKSQTP